MIETHVGDQADDYFGWSDIDALPNSNLAIASGHDNIDGSHDNAGSIMLIDGATGAQIGTTLFGDSTDDFLGGEESTIFVLSNNNFVVVSEDNNNGSPSVDDVGSVSLIDGATGALIETYYGDLTDESLGSGEIEQLTNGNFVIASPYDGLGAGGNDEGSVKLINGTTGAVIATHVGDQADDKLGWSDVDPLPNGGYAVASKYDTAGGSVDDIGSVMTFGADGVMKGTKLVGVYADDKLGRALVVSTNGNYLVKSQSVDNGTTTVDAGSIMLIDHTTGLQIGNTIFGDNANDQLGEGKIFPLNNGNFLVFSPSDDVGATDNGSMMLISGTTGLEIGAKLAGGSTDDFEVSGNYGAETTSVGDFIPSFYVVFAEDWDQPGKADAGFAKVFVY